MSIEELCKKLGRSWPAISKAESEADGQIQQIRRKAKKEGQVTVSATYLLASAYGKTMSSGMTGLMAIALPRTRFFADARRLLEQGRMMRAQPVENAVLQFFGQVAQFLDFRVTGNTGGFVDAPTPLRSEGLQGIDHAAIVADRQLKRLDGVARPRRAGRRLPPPWANAVVASHSSTTLDNSCSSPRRNVLGPAITALRKAWP